jgi:protein required for attachment to host cells
MRACIAIIDSTKARICEYDERFAAGEEFHELAALTNPGRRHIGAVFEDEVGGSRDAANATHQQATDDHRQGYVETRDHKFARDVVGEIERIVREGSFGHLVIVAAPHMLGELRKYDAPVRRDDVKIDEYDRDLGGMNEARVHDHLAHAGIIPPRRRMAAAR